jgi:hypothetical protein
MNWTSKCIRQFGCVWPSSPHQKQVSTVPSFGHGGTDALKAGVAALNVPRVWATGGRNHKTVVGSIATCGRGL